MASFNNPSSSVLYSRVAYTPPPWIAESIPPRMIPKSKVLLGRFPTPIHKWSVFPTPDENGVEMWIKRDDLSSNDLSGNKVRKLEFLLSAAMDGGHDSVITIGGVQSNHCRATAVAARQLGLDPYLILRTRNAVQDDPNILYNSLAGNLLYNRMVGADIRTVTASTYASIGSSALLHQRTEQLIDQGKNPFPIPVGGSNPLGCFGYLEAMNEIRLQEEETGILFDHIVFSCGSGGTAAGLAIGARLSGFRSIHAIGVCDSPAYFYDHIRQTALDLGIDFSRYGDVEAWLTIHSGAGIGYARSTEQELQYLLQVSRKTGIILDPVYSGKAMYFFATNILPSNPEVFQKGHRVLFIHTGGTAGLYDKADQLAPLLGGGIGPMSVSKS